MNVDVRVVDVSAPVMFLTAALVAAHKPIVGVQRRWPETLHGVPLENLKLDNWATCRTVEAGCGRRVALLAGLPMWAPKVKGTPLRRCPECEALYGKRMPPAYRWMQPKAETPTEAGA